MANLSDILTYVLSKCTQCQITPTPQKLIKILFLIDWKSSISKVGQPMTGIKWKIVESEPKIDDDSIKGIVEFVEKGSRLIPSGFWRRFSKHRTIGLTAEQKRMIDFVVESLSGKDPHYLDKLVCSIYPVVSTGEADFVDLPWLAKEYQEVKPMLRARTKSVRPYTSFTQKKQSSIQSPSPHAQ